MAHLLTVAVFQLALVSPASTQNATASDGRQGWVSQPNGRGYVRSSRLID